MQNKTWRRLYIVRKDLNLSPGKLAAQLCHCSEIFWLNLIINHMDEGDSLCMSNIILEKDLVDNYINGHITKTVCEAKNLNHLLKAAQMANELGLQENEDYGFINDACFTELKPENENGTTTTAIWFAPLPDEIIHNISKKYQLYKERSPSND